MSADVPSGRRRRAARRDEPGAIADDFSRARVRRGSQIRRQGGVSKQRDRPSSRRWSMARSGARRHSRPSDRSPCRRWRASDICDQAVDAAEAGRVQVKVLRRRFAGDGQASSATQRSGMARDTGLRAPGLLHPDAVDRLVHDAGVIALQPVVPPAQGLLQIADRRARHAAMRIGVGPRADQRLAAATDSPRAAAGRRWNSRPPSRRRHRPGIDARRSPRRPSRASSRRRGADARASAPSQERIGLAAAPATSRASAAPTSCGSGGSAFSPA